MSPAVNTLLALLSLGLAILAIVLATIANRRWTRRPGRGAGLEGESHRRSSDGPDRDDDAAGAASSHQAGLSDRADREGRPDRASRPDQEVLAAALTSLRTQVEDLSAHVEDLGTQTGTVRSDVEALRGQVEALTARADEPRDPTALRHVALVRYDAFADVGGRLSYSVALLDDTSSGLVLTTLAGKADVRTYVRTISAGAPDGSLTAEEQQAIDAAVGSRQ